MASKTSCDTPPFALSDGQAIAAESVEADLRARVATCEDALEDAVWQLAQFYSAVGRHVAATACVERCNAGTQDLGKQAARYMILGGALEQQARYAEAEAVYAHGLEIPAAPAEVRYFLHNNRGYCLILLGRHAEAEAHTREAIAIDPGRHDAHTNLGLALAGQRNFHEAACCLLEADRRCPGDGRARQHLAHLLAAHPELLLDDLDLAEHCRVQGVRVRPVGNA